MFALLASLTVGLHAPVALGGLRRSSARALVSCCGADSSESAEAWRVALAELNAAPVFALAGEAGNMLQFEEDGKPLVALFADIDRALEELEKSRSNTPGLGLRIVPLGLGDAYQQQQQGKALVIPGAEEVREAQAMQLSAPAEATAMLASAGIAAPVVEWERDVLPVFGCAQILRRRPDGTRFVPLFMCKADAQKAFDAAVAANPERADADGFEIDCTPLPEMLELAVSKKGVRPRLIPPSQSTAFLQGKYPLNPPPIYPSPD